MSRTGSAEGDREQTLWRRAPSRQSATGGVMDCDCPAPSDLPVKKCGAQGHNLTGTPSSRRPAYRTNSLASLSWGFSLMRERQYSMVSPLRRSSAAVTGMSGPGRSTGSAGTLLRDAGLTTTCIRLECEQGNQEAVPLGAGPRWLFLHRKAKRPPQPGSLQHTCRLRVSGSSAEERRPRRSRTSSV